MRRIIALDPRRVGGGPGARAPMPDPGSRTPVCRKVPPAIRDAAHLSEPPEKASTGHQLAVFLTRRYPLSTVKSPLVTVACVASVREEVTPMFPPTAAGGPFPRSRREAWARRMAAAALAAIAAVILAGAGAEAASPSDLEVALRALSIRPWWGEAPRLTLAALDGQRHSVDNLRGRAVLLYFWATW